MRIWRCLLVLLALAAAASSPAPASADAPALADVQTIGLPGVLRRIDHFAIDPSGKRLFVAALGNGSLEVLDVGAGKRITSIRGLKEPQGVAFLPLGHRIVVATRKGGSVAAFDDVNYRQTGVIPNLGDADNLRYDAAASLLYVGYGEGALGVIEPGPLKLINSIPVGGHPESFRLEESGPRIFVNVPDTRDVVVVDRARRSVVQRISLGHLQNNYPMSLDERGQRLFIAVRQPAELLVFDTATAKQIAAVPCVGDSDDLFYDARRDRVYVIGGEGYLDVFDAAAAGKYGRIARFKTRTGARTGLWSPELDRLFVAWPNRDGHAAEIHAYAP